MIPSSKYLCINGYTRRIGIMDTMDMVYTDSSHLTVTEDPDSYIWKYTFTLCDGYLLVESRYPDKKFYKAE